ncbi:sulfurtransferase TusD [Moraxella caviae]|uniref:Sulfurtransferase TusD n=1 Tax=Moraxella caviae TaxID=34060 RepID=A0A1T0A705_9GAMM|nr:sulfurtransferase complex subunit TusD [Moraxella caviae]OOR91514.1 sulfurtransferase TusD [Moraxella caviae]STZ14400.1 Sulfurtransferase TusD [Moraxella caviae]VEW10513.1 Sulfurtransferase TusD [Moraxella caviae]
MSTLLLISAPPHSRKAAQAIDFAKEKLAKHEKILVFFYGDGAYTANRLQWQTADVPSITDAWAALAREYSLELPVCVSTALARGITDSDNAARHGLDGENLRTPFRLAGLSELAMQLDMCDDVVQF